MTIQDITTFSELQEIAQTKKYIVIDFYADWCGPCKKLKPLFLEWSQNTDYQEISFLKVDADQDEDLCQKYSIKGLPTVVFLNPECENIYQVIGFDPEKIENKLKTLCNDDSNENVKIEYNVKQDIFNLTNFIT
jgi:thioredoxin 1